RVQTRGSNSKSARTPKWVQFMESLARALLQSVCRVAIFLFLYISASQHTDCKSARAVFVINMHNCVNSFYLSINIFFSTYFSLTNLKLQTTPPPVIIGYTSFLKYDSYSSG